MPNPYFSFKKFTVYHDKCAMKVGIDGVLLGAWANVKNTQKILDIGTGTGLIALMLAQRSNADILAIDIEETAIIQALENISNSPWHKRIRASQTSLQKYTKSATEKFDLIVSNPPYFINSTKAPEENRNTARHTDSLTHEDLIDKSIQLLNPTSKLCIILPVSEGLECISYAESKGLFCTKLVMVFPKSNVPAKRVLIEFSREFAPREISELQIETDTRHHYSPEFTALAKDFYLKL
jgi:tRNA1Val (adenine37-N6)-methyltransferase